MNLAEELGALIAAAGLRMTFDRRRSTALPCWLCETTTEERELVTIGTYSRAMGGNIQPGDPIDRPLCARCADLTAQPASEPKVTP